MCIPNRGHRSRSLETLLRCSLALTLYEACQLCGGVHVWVHSRPEEQFNDLHTPVSARLEQRVVVLLVRLDSLLALFWLLQPHIGLEH